ncbi:methyltransferase domain-containing protein [Streptomyces sp. A7024]|uniref:Methyltransferase domain-containing protein n=1 Tax=Streptomyces coryli TaxID=1128680 RepID=A0A6G4U7Z8_9ACTN|nr:class I SAM-dependent methyltransferase [Streptomyces coryli]NGN68365.1 methyltransferase domain-containing protein [Streptomyces coryli]
MTNPTARHAGHRGTGPGAKTPDGCAVDLYARLKAGREPDVIAAAIPAGATLLELGCGAGRVTEPLAARGFRVTAVDESAEMLERVRDRAPAARTVHAPIEDLDLGERFDAVTLASFLVHTVDDRQRAALLAACRRHVRADGCVLIEREGPDWHTNRSLPHERHDEAAGCTTRVVSAEPAGDGRLRMRMEYVWPDATWAHEFFSRPLTEEAFEGHLDAAGLAVDRYLTDDGVWVRAVPV